MKQLPSNPMVSKTQIVLILKNTFKAASLSCYIIDSKNYWITTQAATLFDKNLPKIHNHLTKLILRVERTKVMYLLWRKEAI